MIIEDCPIINVNVKVWKFWSWILRHNYMRYISVVPVTILNFFQFTDLYSAWGNIGKVIINAYFAVLYFNAVVSIRQNKFKFYIFLCYIYFLDIQVRALVLIIYRKKYENFLQKIAQVYEEIANEKDDEIQTVLTNYTKRGRIFSIFNLGLGAFISTCFVVYPLLTGTRTLPYGMYIPGVDNYATPTYEIFFILQVIYSYILTFTCFTMYYFIFSKAILTFPGCCMYIPYTNFYTTCTLFVLIQIKTLKHQIIHLKDHDEDNATIDNKLNGLIKVHQRIIESVA